MTTKILYFSNSRFPLAAVAGALHTGLLPGGGRQNSLSLSGLQFLNLKDNFEGQIIACGNDIFNNDIYALAVKGDSDMPVRLVESFLRLNGLPARSLLFVDCGVCDNWWLLAGNLFDKLRLTKKLGSVLICAGINKHYKTLVELTDRVKDSLAKSLD
ncbi:MAG: DUF3189 family protein [Peptococcaceae bacterium]|nr:DUF3189 family protein [Peptococcaceae bacterium]